MQHRRHARGFAAVILSLVATALLAVGSVAAHTQTVNPNGNGETFTKPVSKPWAEAHCQAQAPFVVYEASNHVVAFNAAVLVCP